MEEVRELPARATMTGADVLREAIADVLCSDRPSVGRLGYARTSVRFRIGDVDDAFTLLLDRKPPSVGGAEEPAAIDVWLSERQARDMAAGRFSVVHGLMAGEVEASGPVRRYMEVDVILRELLADHEDALQWRPAEAEAGRSVPLAADRLSLETRNLHKSFGESHILRGCDLAIPEGVVSVLLGPSGTGKSVVLQHVIGLMQPDEGEVVIRGESLSDMSHSEILALRREIGVMFQDGALFSAMDVYDNVAFPLRQHTNLPEAAIREVVLQRLADVGLSGAKHRMPNALSGGMRKRAGLARSLVLDPSIVLCDEPDSGLDPVRTSLLGDLLVQQHGEHGGTMVVVTHNVPLARQIADHITVLFRGQVVEQGPAAHVFASEEPFVRQFLERDTQGPLGMDA